MAAELYASEALPPNTSNYNDVQRCKATDILGKVSLVRQKATNRKYTLNRCKLERGDLIYGPFVTGILAHFLNAMIVLVKTNTEIRQVVFYLLKKKKLMFTNSDELELTNSNDQS